MYQIKEIHKNGKNSFEKIREKVIPTKEMAEGIKFNLDQLSLDLGWCMQYEIIELEVIEEEYDFYNGVEKHYLDYWDR